MALEYDIQKKTFIAVYQSIFLVRRHYFLFHFYQYKKGLEISKVSDNYWTTKLIIQTHRIHIKHIIKPETGSSTRFLNIIICHDLVSREGKGR